MSVKYWLHIDNSYHKQQKIRDYYYNFNFKVPKMEKKLMTTGLGTADMQSDSKSLK